MSSVSHSESSYDEEGEEEESSDYDDSDSELSNSSSDIFFSDSDSEPEGEGRDENYSYPIKEYTWRTDSLPEDCAPPEFTALAGMQVQPRDNSPLELFELLFNDEIVNMIVSATNNSGNQMSDSLKHKYNWVEVTAYEIKILVVKLICQQSNYTLHLNTENYDDCRIMLIYKLICFTHNENSRNVLNKCKPFTDMVRKRFQDVYVPRQKLIIDERMTFVSKGPMLTCQAYTICSYVVSECQSGYIWNMIFRLCSPSPQTHEFETGYKPDMLFSLMEGLLYKGYHVYTMNYYNSLELALHIQDKNTGFVGSMRPKVVNIPKELKDKELDVGQGSHMYETSGKMMVLKWNFRRSAYIVSTVHRGEETVEVMKKKKPTVVPKLIADYEAADENVQFEDFCLSYFDFERPKLHVINQRKVFRHVLNLIVSNAHALHIVNGGNFKFTKFKMVLCNALMKKYL